MVDDLESRPKQPLSTNQRLTDIADPQVSALLEIEVDDKVGNLIEHLSELTLAQKVHALLLLSDNQFDDFRERRGGGAEFALQKLASEKGLIGNEDYIRAQSQLRDAIPRYEIEAEVRRRQGGNYPPEWDQELEEDVRFKDGDGLLRFKEGERLTYEEALVFTRFENARSWYRNSFFPQATRFNNPIPLDMSTLVDLFRTYKEKNFDPQKPGTDITMKDLITTTEYYLAKESDNEENCQVHQRVQKFAGIIRDLEDAIENPVQ